MAREISYVEEVFTPAIQAVKTFVERDRYTTDILVDSLRTPGKQIVLYGHSGSGKSTLLKNKLHQVYEHRIIITRCTKSMTYENLLLNAFDQLDKYFINEISTNRSQKLSLSFSLFESIKDINNKLKIELANELQNKQQRLISPQLTPQNLAMFMGELKACWILEDLHKMPENVKEEFAQIMKLFVDCSVDYNHLKIIVLGALNSGRDIIQYDSEMNDRVSEIYVGLMKDEEIDEIISKGEQLLNLYFTKEIKDMIIKISNGVPSIVHQLCLNICFTLGIYQTQEKTIFIKREEFYSALRRYIDERSDTLKKDFDRAVKSDNEHSSIPMAILKEAINSKKHEFCNNDILKKPSFILNKLSLKDISKYLDQFCLEERGQILKFDKDSNKYSFSNYFIRSYAILRIESEHHEVMDSKSKIKEVLIEILVSDGFLSSDTNITEEWIGLEESLKKRKRNH